MAGSMARAPVVAGQFYPAQPHALWRDIKRCTGDYAPPPDLKLKSLVGGIVPHAGWVFSGSTAAKVFVTLANQVQPEIYVLFGAVHHWGGRSAAVYPGGKWTTPLGELQVAESVATSVVHTSKGIIVASEDAHESEHSIEVQLPFIQAFSPQAGILPVAVPPIAEATSIGKVVANVILEQKINAVVIASTDLTHYGMGYGLPDHGPPFVAMPWMRENDRRMIELIKSMSAEKIVAEATKNHNACGAGATAAAVSAAHVLGAQSARVLEYTTSADVMPEQYADRAVGYVGMVFERNIP